MLNLSPVYRRGVFTSFCYGRRLLFAPYCVKSWFYAGKATKHKVSNYTYFITNTNDLQLTATPDTINEGVTMSLVVNCSLDSSRLPKGFTLISLIVSHKSLHGTQTQSLTEIASVNSFDPLPYHVTGIGHTKASMSGSIDTFGGTSFLSLTWSQPTNTELGLYVCKANILDASGHPLTEVKDFLVEEEASELQKYANTIGDLTNKIKGAESCSSSLSQSIYDLETTSNRLTLALAYVERSLLFHRFRRYKGRKYYLSKYAVEDADTAQVVCETLNGYLAEIQDQDELTFVSGFFTPASIPNFLLLGARDEHTEGQWFWTHSKTKMTFDAFRQGEPNNRGQENCLEMSYISNNASWNDIACHALVGRGFLCEVPNPK